MIRLQGSQQQIAHIADNRLPVVVFLNETMQRIGTLACCWPVAQTIDARREQFSCPGSTDIGMFSSIQAKPLSSFFRCDDGKPVLACLQDFDSAATAEPQWNDCCGSALIKRSDLVRIGNQFDAGSTAKLFNCAAGLAARHKQPDIAKSRAKIRPDLGHEPAQSIYVRPVAQIAQEQQIRPG
ncbi:MAG: hypothetical protein AAF299_12345, partial [Pseudomonadota bacterium]